MPCLSLQIGLALGQVHMTQLESAFSRLLSCFVTGPGQLQVAGHLYAETTLGTLQTVFEAGHIMWTDVSLHELSPAMMHCAWVVAQFNSGELVQAS